MAHQTKPSDKWSEMESSKQSLEVPEKSSSGRSSPAQTATEPARRTPSPHSHATRANAPSTLPVELQLKVRTQQGRLRSMKRLLTKLQDNAGQLTKEELDDLKQQADEALKAFSKEHAHFEVVWPSSMTDHPYFSEELHEKMQDSHSDAKSLIAKERARLTAQRTDHQSDQPSKTPAQSKLPDIALPKFNGSYTDWPSFIDLFTSVVINREDLDDVQKFYYLKGCLRGEPLKIINNLSLTGPSLNAAIAQLKSRYENKRRLIQAHLDQLASLLAGPLVMGAEQAKSLSTLISTALETRNAVLNLTEPGTLEGKVGVVAWDDDRIPEV